MSSVTIASPYVNTSLISPRDDSFSSYLTLVRESFSLEPSHIGRNPSSIQINSSRRRNTDGEIDIFGAEKYFNGTMDDKTGILPDKELYLPSKKDMKSSAKSRSTRSASTWSEASGNSRTALIRKHSKATKADGKKLLSVFLCNCSGKKATEIEVEVESVKESLEPFGEWRMRNEIRLASEMRMKRLELGFTESLFNGAENLKGMEGKQVFGRELNREGMKKVNSGRKESLNPLSEIQSTAVYNVCNGSGGSTYNRGYVGGVDNFGNDDDNCSESSSDLFEINSISMNSSSFFEHDTAGSVVYEPSEVSIDWSVVTASAANVSVASRFDEPRKQSMKVNKKGLLMGCVSHKAVDVTTDSRRYKLIQRTDTTSMPDMPVQIGHEALVAPAMRYQVESLKKKGLRTAPPQHIMPTTRPLSRIQARQQIYV